MKINVSNTLEAKVFNFFNELPFII